MQLTEDLLLGAFARLGYVFLPISMLVMTMLNASVLTALYGHYIEGRPLD